MELFRPFYKKHREAVRYLFFGGWTFFIGIVVYAVLVSIFGIYELVSNAISWVCGVTFSYFTTKRWVFLNDNWKPKYVIFQMGSFFARGFSHCFYRNCCFIFS